jgi:predicted nucleotidyltransferase
MTNKEEILHRLRQTKDVLLSYGVASIGLFGSFIRNEATPSSDIDILIDFHPSHETFDNFMAVCDLLETVFPEQAVEVVTRNGLSQYIGPAILKEVEYA